MFSNQKHTIKKDASYYLTLTVVDWVDVFTRANHKDAIISSLKFCIKNKGLNVYAFCLMTNHLHLVVNCDDPFELKDVIRDFKRHTVKQIVHQIINEPESRREWILKILHEKGEESSQNSKIKFWKSGNHAIELYTEKFVRKPEDWIYSSASNYILDHGIIEDVVCLTPPLNR
ncbi:MAG: transposase [Crocinitomicaceae bacterium]|nr:transposase [Crocinitomicaceae bacterium]